MDRHRGGQILVLVALALFVLVAFVALAVDVGHIYRERRHMQRLGLENTLWTAMAPKEPRLQYPAASP